MSGIGDFLESVFEWLYEFWPVRVVDEGTQGVKYRLGVIQHPALTHENGWWRTGLHFFRPLADEIHTRATNVEVEELDWQTLRLASGVECTAAFSHRYRILELDKTYAKVVSGSGSINDATRTAIAKAAFAKCRTINDVARKLPGPKGAAAVEARKQMRGWGVDLIETNVISLTAAKSLRLIVDPIGGAGEEAED